MADISWSAYALAMFTPEQRAAAVNAIPDDAELRPLPPQPPAGGIPTQEGMGKVLVNGIWYDPNNPLQLKVIHEAGWRYFGGKWVAPVAGRARTADELMRDGDPGGSGRVGLSSVSSASAVPGGSVLGNVVPVPAPVLLPSFVGGRIGTVRMGGGMRPDAGGAPDRVKFGDPQVLPVVRMAQNPAGGGGGGGSW